MSSLTQGREDLQPESQPIPFSSPEPIHEECLPSPSDCLVSLGLSDSSYDTGRDSGTSIFNEMSCDESMTNIDSESDGKSDYSSITDDGYLVSNEETGTILWQHVKFYIVHNPVRGPHHILAPREAPYLLKSSRDSTV